MIRLGAAREARVEARLRSSAGFTLNELLMASAIMLSVMAAIFGLVGPAQGTFQAQTEVSDMQQRLRVGVNALARDLLMAGAVMPYREGRYDNDPDIGVFYRPDTITTLDLPSTTTITSHTYYLKSDIAVGTFQLMHYNGDETDLPVVDHVVTLEFQYFGVAQERLDPSLLQDGPWYPDDMDPKRYDVDLMKIRRVGVMLRVQAALAAMRGPAGILFVHGGTSTSAERYVPDRTIRFDVTPRNMNLERQ